MKNKFLTVLTAVFVLGLAMAVYAFNQPNSSVKTAASCCAKSDSCPLKNKNATAENHSTGSCCEMDDCCCKNGSCPMKSGGETGASACCASCPMKNRKAQMTMTQTGDETVADGENCHHDQAGI